MASKSYIPWHDAPWSRLSAQLAGDQLPHALLLTGGAGLGKRLFARRLAAAYLCSSRAGDGSGCGVCRDCKLFEAGSHPDWIALEPEEGKSDISVAAVRELISRLMLTGGSGRRAALIDPAHAMNRASANALLKTLEEPPAGVLILLVSESPHRLPATIRSRCQVLNFRAPDETGALDWLHGQAELADGEWHDTLRLAGGAPLRALQLSQRAAREQREALLDGLTALTKGDANPSALAAAWCKETPGLADLLDTFARWLAMAGCAGLHESPLRRLLDGVKPKSLFALYDEVNRVRASLDTQLRSDLMIESLLIQWLRLTADSEAVHP